MAELPRPDQVTRTLGELRAAETKMREYARKAYSYGDYDVLLEAARKAWGYAGERESLASAAKAANAVVTAFASEKSTPTAGYAVPTYGKLTEAVDRLCTAYERALEELGDG